MYIVVIYNTMGWIKPHIHVYLYGRRAAHHWSLPEVFPFLPRWCQTSRKWWKPSTARCPPSMRWLGFLKRRTTPHLWSATGWLLSYLYIYMEIGWSNFTTTEITTYNCVCFMVYVYIKCVYIYIFDKLEGGPTLWLLHDILVHTPVHVYIFEDGGWSTPNCWEVGGTVRNPCQVHDGD